MEMNLERHNLFVMRPPDVRIYSSSWYFPACLSWTFLGIFFFGYYLHKLLASGDDLYHRLAVPVWAIVALVWGIRARRADRFHSQLNQR